MSVPSTLASSERSGEPVPPRRHISAFYAHTHKVSKTCVKRPLSKRSKMGFQDQLSLNAGQKYCRMLQGAFCNLHQATICH